MDQSTVRRRLTCTAAEAVEAAIGEASRTVRVSKLEVTGTVRVSCPPAFISHLHAALAAVRDKYPSLRLTLT